MSGDNRVPGSPVSAVDESAELYLKYTSNSSFYSSSPSSTAMPPPSLDYTLYLVTDSTPAILGDRELVDVVRAAVAGGMSSMSRPRGRPVVVDAGPDATERYRSTHVPLRSHRGAVP